MIKLHTHRTPQKLARRLITFEEQNITGVRNSFKLALTHIIESPWFTKSLRTLLLLIALAFHDLVGEGQLPAITVLLALRLEEEHAVQALDFDLKLLCIFLINVDVSAEMVEVEDPIWVLLLLGLPVRQFIVFNDHISLLPTFKQRGRVLVYVSLAVRHVSLLVVQGLVEHYGVLMGETFGHSDCLLLLRAVNIIDLNLG